MRRGAIIAAFALAIVVGLGGWRMWRQDKAPQAAAKGGGAAVPVTAVQVERRDVPVRLRANGTAVALQSVEVRAQITSTVREVHIREGQSVARGDLMFSLDARAEEANLKKAQAQVEKDRADLANAQRTLERQRQLFEQKFISQSALDAAQNQVETLKGQLAVDLAAVEGTKVALGNTRIHASFAGRTGTIGVRPGSLVQPNGTVLVTVTQTDPIQVGFTLPEKEFTGLQRALAAGPVMVEVSPDGGREVLKGRVNFLDNAVDTVTGTIRVKAEFDNRASRLWPGMFVNVLVSPRTLGQASIVPVQAVQTGPEYRFVYVIGEDRKVALRKVGLEYIDEGIAVVTGIEPGTKVVLEGAQNLRPGSVVSLGERAPGSVGGDAGGKAGGGNSGGKAGGGNAPGAKSGPAS